MVRPQRTSRPLPKPLLGSYQPEDCLFLLTLVQPKFQDIENKEHLIQTGALHYSEMIHREDAPTKEYTSLFYALVAKYKRRLAHEIIVLANRILQARGPEITLCSLARAGTPIGVLLQRALTQYFNADSVHYSISIIRDRGVDRTALDYILSVGRSQKSIVFVDGWTAKGVIGRELYRAVEDYNQRRGAQLAKELFVISDIGGSADHQATFDDYAIPSALMNATVSGLLSRTILNEQLGPDDFHGCVRYQHLASVDLSQWFVDEVSECMSSEYKGSECMGDDSHGAPQRQQAKQALRRQTQHFLTLIQHQYRVSDYNRIKPGVAEATRVMLRRVPDLLLLRRLKAADTLHLEKLAEEKNIAVVVRNDMPFGACALIKDVLR